MDKKLIEQLQEVKLEEGWGQNLAAGALAATTMFGPMGVPSADAATAHHHEHSNSRFEKGLQPALVQKLHELEALAKEHGIDFRLTSGYRSPAEQAKLYAQGRTTPGKIVTHLKHSKHNEGKAFDVVILRNGQPVWGANDYAAIGKLGQSIGLTWGGTWKMKDLCHFQID